MERTQTILAYNKLIAEFMGFKKFNNNHYRCVLASSKINKIVPPQYMEFNSSWDWLMPVVDKITGMYHRFMFKSDEGEEYCEIWCYSDNVIDKEIEVFGETKIEAIYNACIEFIKWHNDLS